MALLIKYDDREYILDLEDMDDDEARAMERFGVKNLREFDEGISDGDLDALTVAYWLMKKQNGEPGVRLERMKFRPIAFLHALGEAAKAEAEKNPEPEGNDEG